MIKRTNVLDPVQPKLDPAIFVNNRVRASVAKFVQDHIYGALEDHFGFDCSKFVHLYLTGSLTTYQYHATSDFDVNLFVDYIKWPGKPDPDDLKKQILRLIFKKIDHKSIPDTDHPIQTFILPQGIEPRDQFDVGLRSAWSFDKKDWVVKPEKDRVINVLQDLSPIYQKAMRTADKMRVLLDQDPEQSIKLYHKIHKKRMREQDLYGDFAEGNIIYKFLDSEGLFTKLRELGVKIAQIHQASWQDVEKKAKRYIEEGRFTNVINNGDFFSAKVNGETGVWQPRIWKDDPNTRSISRWACTCPWGQNSWGRTRSWIKYEGRPCAHILGLHWLSQGTPKDFKEDLETLIPQVEWQEAPKTAPITPPDEYPLQNGDMVIVKPQVSIDAWDPHDPEDWITIPQNTVGVVLEQVSENLVRVMFPNPTGWYHENKMYEAIENPNKFYISDTARDPFVKRPPGYEPNDQTSITQPQPTSKVASVLPVKPGETPIPEGNIRLYHYTDADPDVIRNEGLRIDKARGDTYGEPNVVWASYSQPNLAIKNVAEFSVPWNDPRWDIGKEFSYERALEGDKYGRHVTFLDSIRPEEIIAVHEPWHQAYHYINESGDPSKFDWIDDDPSPEFDPYRKALQVIRQQKTSKIASDDIWDDFDAATPENERLRNEMNQHLERPWHSPLFTDEILQQKLTELEAKGYGHESTARSIRLELIWRSMGEIT